MAWDINLNKVGRLVSNLVSVGYRPENNVNARTQGLDDLWSMALALGAPIIWTSKYDGLIHVELHVQSGQKDELKIISSKSFDVNECLRNAIDKAMAFGVRPNASGRFNQHAL